MDSNKTVVDCLYLFNQSPAHRLYTLVDFNSAIIYPLLHNKLRVFYENDKPVSLVTWCWLTVQETEDFLEDVYVPDEAAYKREVSDNLWVMDFIAPFGHVPQTMRLMRHVCKELYGPQTAVHWIRQQEPQRLHKRIF